MWVPNNKFLILCFSFFLCFSCKEAPTNKLNIACSANAQYAIEEISQSFEEIYGIQSNVIIASSGKLTAQVKAGAPFDIFVSADMAYPNELYNADLTTGPPKSYATGGLAIWTINPSINLDNLFQEDFNLNHIAIANPKTAPYGKAAMQYLNTLSNFDKIKAKLVFGESIAQTNQFILSGAADLGITSTSNMYHPKFSKEGHWKAITSSSVTQIEQAAVVIANTTKQEKAEKYFSFLFSDEAKKILLKFGYSVEN